MEISSLSLRGRLLTARPAIARSLGKLDDRELRELATAVVMDRDAIVSMRKQFDAHSRSVHADNAGIHGSGRAVRARNLKKLVGVTVDDVARMIEVKP